MDCGVGCRCGSDSVWLWHWLAAAAPIGPLDWELPYAAGMTPKSKTQRQNSSFMSGFPKPTAYSFPNLIRLVLMPPLPSGCGLA